MSAIEEYLDSVCGEIRTKSVHKQIRAELKEHIDSLVSEYVDNNMDRKSAEEKAVLQMGDPKETGAGLNRQHKPKIEWSLIVLTAMLAALGLFINRSYTSAFQKIIFTALGALGLIGGSLVNYTRLKKISFPAFVIFTAVLVILGGDLGYIYMGGIHLSVSSLSQLLIPLSVGFMFKNKSELSFWRILGIMAVLFFVPMLSYSIMFCACLFIMMTAAAFKGHFKKRLLAVPVILGAGSVGIFAFKNPYVINRIAAFVTKGSSDPLGSGYIVSNIAAALKSASFVGKAPEGTHWTVVENMHTDYPLINVLGQYGFIAAIAIIAVCAALIVRMYKTVGKAKNDYGYWLAFSCCTLLCLKFVMNILVQFNFMPFMGITLPLIGMGGTDYIITMFLVGTVLSVYRRSDLFPESCDGRKLRISIKYE